MDVLARGQVVEGYMGLPLGQVTGSTSSSSRILSWIKTSLTEESPLVDPAWWSDSPSRLYSAAVAGATRAMHGTIVTDPTSVINDMMIGRSFHTGSEVQAMFYQIGKGLSEKGNELADFLKGKIAPSYYGSIAYKWGFNRGVSANSVQMGEFARREDTEDDRVEDLTTGRDDLSVLIAEVVSAGGPLSRKVLSWIEGIFMSGSKSEQAVMKDYVSRLKSGDLELGYVKEMETQLGLDKSYISRVIKKFTEKAMDEMDNSSMGYEIGNDIEDYRYLRGIQRGKPMYASLAGWQGLSFKEISEVIESAVYGAHLETPIEGWLDEATLVAMQNVRKSMEGRQAVLPGFSERAWNDMYQTLRRAVLSQIKERATKVLDSTT